LYAPIRDQTVYMQTVFHRQSVAVFFVILLTKRLRIRVGIINGTKLEVNSLFDRHLLMNSYPAHSY